MFEMNTLSTDPDDFLFFDTETRALEGLQDPRWGDVTKSGAARYGKSCKVTIFRYCIGEDGPMRCASSAEVARTTHESYVSRVSYPAGTVCLRR